MERFRIFVTKDDNSILFYTVSNWKEIRKSIQYDSFEDVLICKFNGNVIHSPYVEIIDSETKDKLKLKIG